LKSENKNLKKSIFRFFELMKNARRDIETGKWEEMAEQSEEYKCRLFTLQGEHEGEYPLTAKYANMGFILASEAYAQVFVAEFNNCAGFTETDKKALLEQLKIFFSPAIV